MYLIIATIRMLYAKARRAVTYIYFGAWELVHYFVDIDHFTCYV